MCIKIKTFTDNTGLSSSNNKSKSNHRSIELESTTSRNSATSRSAWLGKSIEEDQTLRCSVKLSENTWKRATLSKLKRNRRVNIEPEKNHWVKLSFYLNILYRLRQNCWLVKYNQVNYIACKQKLRSLVTCLKQVKV